MVEQYKGCLHMVNKLNIPRPIYFTAKIHTCFEHSLVTSINL